MKKVFIFIFALILLLTSCNSSTPTSSEMDSDNEYETFVAKYNEISNEISLQLLNENENLSISPSSILNLIAIIYEATNINNKQKISEVFGVPKENLNLYFEQLFNSLEKEYYQKEIKYTEEGEAYRELKGGFYVDNSFWYNKSFSIYSNKGSVLMEKYELNIHKVLFDLETKNKINDHVKKVTNGLIDLSEQLQITEDTLYLLMNLQYLMDSWGKNKLEYSEEKYSFKNTNGSVLDTNFLVGNYVDGRIIEKEKYSYFYAETENGYKLKFILPQENYTLNDILNKDILNEINKITDFNHKDESNVVHTTRCIFPKFETSYCDDVLAVLNSYFGNVLLDSALLSELLKYSETGVDKLIHSTKVQVDENGIEAAAATVVVNYTGSTIKTYHDFVIDRDFAYIITDANDVELFVGKVNSIN